MNPDCLDQNQVCYRLHHSSVIGPEASTKIAGDEPARARCPGRVGTAVRMTAGQVCIHDTYEREFVVTCKARWHEKGAALRPPESRAYTPAPPIAVDSPRCSPSLCTCCKAPRSSAVRLLGAFHWRKGRPDSYCSSCTSARCRCLSRGHTWACRLLPKSSFDVLGEAMRARLRRVRYRLTPPPRPQTCKDCWTRDGVDFHVSESVWRHTCVRIGDAGSPYPRFQRALATGNLHLIRAAAAELPHVDLGDALAVCLAIREAEPERFERAALRWLARYAVEKPAAWPISRPPPRPSR